MATGAKKRAKAGYMISAVGGAVQAASADAAAVRARGAAEASRSQGNTRLYTDSDLERLDVISRWARDMGVNWRASKLS